MNNNNILSEHDIQYYYSHFFPYSWFGQWLLTNSKYPLSQREFSYSEDMRNRYKTVENMEQLKQYLVHYCPNKLDIGPVYNRSPIQRNDVNLDTQQKVAFFEEEKELVFDVDITDYDKQFSRSCCEPKSMCAKCWPLMICAYRILKYFIIEEFNYQQYIAVFSGRRGFHLWISDEAVKQYTTMQRTNLLQEVTFDYSKLSHPTFQYIYTEYLLPCFEDMVIKQGYFDSQDKCLQICNQCDMDASTRDKLMNVLMEEKENNQRWKYFKQFMLHGTNNTDGLLTIAFQKLIFNRIYPKLDEAVTKQMIHLLKAPYSIHPANGNICVHISETSTFEELQRINISHVHDSTFAALFHKYTMS